MRKKETKKDSNKEDSKINRELLISLLNKGKAKAYNFKQLARKMGLADAKSKSQLAIVLEKMMKVGDISEIGNGYFKFNKKSNTVTGRVDYVNAKFAFVISEEYEADIWVSSRDLNYALDGDIVKVAIHKELSEGKKAEGEVVEIVQRAKKDIVGKIELSARYAFVVPDSRKMFYDIFIPQEQLKDVKHGDKVIVELTQFPGKDKNPVGSIKEVLGASGDNDVEMHAIMAEFGLPYAFPEKLEEMAEIISTEISKEEIKRRRDFRNTLTFTIDPVDAKDFDDALSIKKLPDGNWEIGVHIADVTHYVQEETWLDKEALNRATSVYLVDRVVPMLPEKLSNNLCSLRPNEDKLTFSAVFELTEEGDILKEWFGKTIIHSARRFSYEEAQEIMDAGAGDHVAELHLMNNIAKKLKDQRFKKGAIGFETVEVRFKLDEKGKPLGIIPKIRKDAHKLIEEFMLLANKRVAEHVYNLKKGKEKYTMVYRTHDYPDPEKINTFSIFAKKFGYELQAGEDNIAEALNKLVVDIEGKPEQNVLQSLAIRTMAKAKYTTEAEIHFGLAFKHYSHFTSPIRRYPDMMAHRLLQQYLEGGKSADQEVYEAKCEHSSDMEKRAADAERASIKYKQAEFMMNAEEKDFAGIVSGVTEWGVFVEIIETKCEGMIRMVDLDDDFYEFDADNYRIIGRHNKRMITLGDEVSVRVKQVNLERRTIDLVFADRVPSTKKKARFDDNSGTKENRFSGGKDKDKGRRRGGNGRKS